MRRQRRMHDQHQRHYADNADYRTDSAATVNYRPIANGFITTNSEMDRDDNFLQMECLTSNKKSPRFENTIEAKVEEGDTLQALALKFHCSVADIKRLNKIDKENEIFARKVIKIPVTVHSVLLGATVLPTVHTSGSNSPNRQSPNSELSKESNIVRNPLEDANIMLNEKLLVAAVNSAGPIAESSRTDGISSSNLNRSVSENINNIILNSKVTASNNVYKDEGKKKVYSCPVLLHLAQQTVPVN